MKQYKHQTKLEKLLDKNPMPCREINRQIREYIKQYTDDNYIKAYSVRYEIRLRADAENPFKNL